MKKKVWRTRAKKSIARAWWVANELYAHGDDALNGQALGFCSEIIRQLEAAWWAMGFTREELEGLAETVNQEMRIKG
jgi:hypothetical protein